MANEPKSRLDREIDEILQKKAKEPVSLLARKRAHETRQAHSTPDWQGQANGLWLRLKAMPMALAYAFVFVAMLVHDASPLLALLLSTAAVASLWVPGILRLTRPAGTSTPNVKYWRGRPYGENVRSAVSRSPIDSLKRYFDRNR